MTHSIGRKDPRWSYVAGEKGRNRVRLFEHHGTGGLYLEVREDGKKKRLALGHRDRDAAKQQADEVAARIGKVTQGSSSEAVAASTPVAPVPEQGPTLKALFDIYVAEVTPQKGESKRSHDHRAARLFLEHFGAACRADTLDRRAWDGYIAWRQRRGDMRLGKTKGQPVRSRQAVYDLKFLHSVLNWAVTARDSAGRYLLERNPLKKMPWPKEAAPNRPTLTAEQYDALRMIAPAVHPLADLLLLVAHETGHRGGAVRLLRWDDVNEKAGTVRWRGENDKMRREHVTPLSDAALAALKERWPKNGGSPWIFPALKDSSQPVARHLLRDWWQQLEKVAKLPHVKGRGWHSLRRKFATECKGLPLRDLMALGGWFNPQTVVLCYTQPDLVTMRQALAQRGRLEAAGLSLEPRTDARTDTLTDTPPQETEATRPT
jgi:integrase